MADVQASLKDWSTTASSNSPTDSTTIGAGLADNLQQIQATVRQDLASKGADIASASTTDLGAVAGLMHDITGTTTITSFGTVAAGIWKLIKFEGALTLTHNATSLILPGGANITTADGDTALMFSEGSGNWRCLNYQKAALIPGKQPTTTVLTSGSGAYNVPSGCTYFIVEGWGGGGAGGGGDGTNRGTGGGGGGYFKKLYTSPAASYSYSVAAAAAAVGQGSGGTAGNGTTFDTCTANGGAAGLVSNGGAQGGVSGGTATGGDENIQGGASTTLEGSAAQLAGVVSFGGDSPRGGFGGKINVSVGGSIPGGGGSTANGTGNSGAGARGEIRIWEFYS